MNTKLAADSEWQVIKRAETRMRMGLAAALLAVTCLFALALSWWSQDTPLAPLLMIQASFVGLLIVYATGVGAAAIYARFIRQRRDPAQQAQRAAAKDNA